ncbi:MAG: shikimate kinase, partial [Planctomycetota bacterium]
MFRALDRAVIENDLDRLAEIERINVIGTSGSGKSTFGRRLAELLDLPFVELDGVYWKPNWQEPTDEEFLPKIKTITDGPRWVLDGNYSRSTPTKWRRVQLVVWLDLPLLRTLYRVATRSVKRAFSKTEIWPGTGNRETLRKAFLTRDSVILWSITSYRGNRRRYGEIMQDDQYGHVWFVRLRSPADVEAFLEAARKIAMRR